MPKSVPHSFFPKFYTLWKHFVYFIIVCVENVFYIVRENKCVKFQCLSERLGRRETGGEEGRMGGGGGGGGENLEVLFRYGYLIFTDKFIIIITI